MINMFSIHAVNCNHQHLRKAVSQKLLLTESIIWITHTKYFKCEEHQSGRGWKGRKNTL